MVNINEGSQGRLKQYSHERGGGCFAFVFPKLPICVWAVKAKRELNFTSKCQMQEVFAQIQKERPIALYFQCFPLD